MRAVSRTIQTIISACPAVCIAAMIGGLTPLPPSAAPAPAPGAETGRFTTVDVYLDPAGRPLAAYQFEFRAARPGIQIVGIEGGDHPAFARPPYYDPAAMMGERLIAAALSTAEASALPDARTRIATVHLRIPAGIEPAFEIRLITAADADGHRFNPLISSTIGSEP